MQKILPGLFLIVLVASCRGNAPSTTAPSPQIASSISPTQNGAINTATAAPQADSSPRADAHWYWSVDSDTAKVIAVNQFGERRELGQLDQEDNLYATSISLDDGRALLFLDSNDTLRVYLLAPDGMQKIALPSEPFYFNTELSQPGCAVVAVYEDYAVFTYVTTDAYQSQTAGAVDTGPVFLVDLKSLTANLTDKDANRDPLDTKRAWFRTSKDGRYLRYINGKVDANKLEIRELDMITGKARTIHTTEGSPSRIYSSPDGDLWYLRVEGVIMDLSGNQTDFAGDTQMATPLKDGKVLGYPWNCVDRCEIRVFSPFGNDAALTYDLPWTFESATDYVKVRQLLPDQSLLFAGLPYAQLSKAPAAVETYPDLTNQDAPLFRLMPDGTARLVGIYVEGDFTSNVSADARFILMKSTDHATFFIYDAVADRSLFSMPIDPELEQYLVTMRFFDNGILVNLSADVPGTNHGVYRSFNYVYYHKTSSVLSWEEEVNAEINNCPDLLDDATLVCWFYRIDSPNFDLIRYDPASGSRTALLENAWLIDFTP